MRRLGYAAGALLLSLGLAVSAVAEVEKVLISYQPGLSYMPLILAGKNKLIQKHAAAAGVGNLTVDWILWICCKVGGGLRKRRGRVQIRPRSRTGSQRRPEQARNEGGLSPHVTPTNVPNLPLSDHRHPFVASQCSSRGWQTAEPETRPDQALDAPMVLLHDVVEVFDLAQA